MGVHPSATQLNLVGLGVAVTLLLCCCLSRVQAQPQLTSFTINLTPPEQLTLTFSSNVLTASCNVSAITLQNTATFTPEGSYTFQQGSCSGAGSLDTIDIMLSGMDWSFIQGRFDLAKSPSNTFISLSPNFITDQNGNFNTPIDGLQILSSAFTSNSQRPILIQALGFDLGSGTLAFLFSEAININTVVVTGITLTFFNTTTVSPQSFRLTGAANIAAFQLDSQVGVAMLPSEFFPVKLTGDAPYLVSIAENTFFDANGMGNPARDDVDFTMGVLPDFVEPELIEFSLDMNSGTITFVFTEPMSTDIDPSMIFLNASSQETGELDGTPLTGSTLLSSANFFTSLTLSLSSSVLNIIKADTSLCTSVDNCYVLLNASSFMDVSMNNVATSLAGLPVSTFTPDTTSPELLSYSIDLDSGAMVLNFSEAVDIAAIDFNGISLSSSSSSSSSVSLNGAVIESTEESDTILNLFLDNDVLGRIVSQTARSPNRLTMTSSAVSGYAGNPVVAIVSSAPLAAVEVIPDTTPPTLIWFAPGAPEDRQITLTFTEYVDSSTWDGRQLSLTLTTNRGLFPYTNFTQGTVTPATSDVLTYTFSSAEFSPPFSDQYATAYSSGSISLLASDGLVTDLSANVFVGNSTPFIYRNSSLPPDTTRPMLLSYTMDLDAGTLGFTFSEGVFVLSVADNVVIQSDATSTPAQIYRLVQNGTISPLTAFDTITLTLADVDLNRLKVNQQLATSLSNTYLVLLEMFGTDLSSNSLVSVPGVQPSTLIADMTGPVIVRFQLDLSTNRIVVDFSEPVQSDSTNNIDYSQFFVSGTSQNPQQQYNLTGTVLSSTTQLSTVVTASLPTMVVNILKSDPNVCTSTSNCYLYVGQGSVRDVTGNDIPASTNGIQADNFVADMTGPSLTGFELDLNVGVLTLTFNEPTDTSSFNPSAILISGANFDSGNAVSLSDATINRTMILNSVLVLDLGFVSLNSLKVLYPTGGFTLTASNSIVMDTSGNPAIAIVSSAPLRPTFINSDITPPTLTSFTPGDPTERRITLVFDEYVNTSTWDATRMTITLSTPQGDVSYSMFTGSASSSGSSGDTLIYTFTTSEFVPPFSDQYSVAYNDGSISISATMELIFDYNRNALPAISPPIRFTTDRTNPTLVSYTLDLNMGVLDMVFSEAVNIIAVAGRVRLQNTATNPSSSYDFAQNGTLQGTSASASIRLMLGMTDLNNVKLDSTLATAAQNTYLVLQDNFARDISGNLLMGALQNGIMATMFVPDTTRPTIVMSDLDLNAGTLRLQFSEPVSQMFDPEAIYLTGDMINAPGGYNLSGSSLTTVTDSSTSFTITLTTIVLDMVKSDSNVCTDRTNCLLFLTMDSFSDTNGNPLQPTSTSTPVSFYVPDTTPPTLVSYIVDLNAGLLTLTFSEPMYTINFSPFGLQLLGQGQSGGSAVRLSGSFISQGLVYNSILVLSFTPQTLNNVKQLATSGGLALTMESFTVSDVARNPVVPIPSSNPLAPATVISDTTPPSLVQFMPGYPNERRLTLVFDEYINPSTLDTSRMTLTLTTSQGPFPYTNIPATTANSTASTTLVLMIPESMFVPPFSEQYQKAYFEGTVFLDVDPGFISDISNNLLATTMSLFYRNSSLPTDIDPPELLSFALDLDMGLIVMTFSENVEIFNVSGQVRIQDSATTPMDTYNIMQDGTVSPPVASDIVTLTLATSDVNNLKLNPSLATSITDTYLVLLPSFAMDTAGNFIADDQTGIRASTFVPDSQGPSVVTFNLDLDSNQMSLTFDEPVRVSTFDTTKITLTNTSSLGSTNRTSVQLMNVEVVADPDSILTSFRFVLRLNDTINVKSQPVCYDRSNCFATFSARLISDVSNNPSPSATSAALQVTTLMQDVTPPRLTAFRVFDLDSGLFNLIFSEPVNGSSTDYTDIQFINSNMNPTINITLTEGFTTPDHVEIDFHLTRNDLNVIKDTPGLCTSRDNCFISLPSFFITDIGMNPFLHQNYQPQAVSGIHQPIGFIPDTTPPVVESYAIDMDAGNLSLSFSEVVQTQMFTPSGLTLQNARNGGVNLTLASQTQYLFSGNDDVVSTTFTSTDFNLLKARDLCSSMSDTYLAVVMNLQDTSNNVFDNVLSANAIQVTTFVSDTTTPLLTSFDLFNIDNGSFIISFSEPVEQASVQATLITILAQPDSQTRYTLTGGQFDYINESKLSLLVTLSMTDRVQVKVMSGLAVNQASTFISIGQGMCTDRNANPVEPVSTSQPVMLTGDYVLDSSEASLQSFSLDMNTGLMMLTFNDVINAASVDVTAITIQNSQELSNIFYTLTSLSVVTSPNSNIITIMIRGNDYTSLKLNLNLATGISDTYISFPSSFARSFEGNAVIGVSSNNSVGVRDYTRDMTSPELSTFSFNLNTGILTLTFTEPVLVSSVRPQSLRFTNRQSSPTTQAQLTGGEVLTTTSSSTSVQILLINNDLNLIKSSTNLATGPADTFVNIVQGNFITDTSGNQVRLTTISISSTGYTADTTPPELQYFDANLTDTGKLTLQFSEAVSLRDGAQTTIALTNAAISPSITLSLATSTIRETFLGVVEVNLVSSLLNRLLRDTNIGTSVNNFYITVGAGGIVDFSNNQVVPLTQGQQVRRLYQSCFDPTPTYNNFTLGTCEPCPSVCVGSCSGPALIAGAGGCGRCYIATFDASDNLESCVPRSNTCPIGYYNATNTVQTSLTQLAQTVCKPCHEHCATCTGPLTTNCQSCTSAIMLSPLNGVLQSCLPTCVNVADPTLCIECHPQCNGCQERTNQDCVACKEASLLVGGQMTCVPGCDSGQYLEIDSQGVSTCQACDDLCTECTGPATTQCQQCSVANLTESGSSSECVSSCPDNMYIDPSLLCVACHDQCDGGCSGPSATNCTQCAEDSIISTSLGNDSISNSTSMGNVECVPFCPLGHVINTDTKRCELTMTMLIVVIVCGCVGGLLLITLVLVAICCCYCCTKGRKGALPIEGVTLISEDNQYQPAVMTSTTSKV